MRPIDPDQPPNDIAPRLNAARQGNKEALGQMLQTYRQYLLLVANQELDLELRGKVGASDLVQDTFLEAQRDFGQFHGTSEAELLAWLRCLLYHNVANTTRRYRNVGKRNLQREVPLAEVPAVDLLRALSDRTDTPRSHAIAREQDQALSRALAQLPEPGRQVIRWRNYDCCSFEEIGRHLGRSAEAARKVWVRALEQLQQLLESSNGTSAARPPG
jgi:RNA polymerase sigma-70 factor (ECF subfamily)